MGMPSEAIYKTVYQYNKVPIADADMARLQEIAEDCRNVRNYVYGRYGGIGGLGKIYPGYTVQNEMTQSGLRERLGLPSVYFYLAVFDALGDIKSQWTRTKKKIEKNIRSNEGFTPEDRHYLRFVMKQGSCFESVMSGGEPSLSGNWDEKYKEVSGKVDTHKLDRYLRRQVRRHLIRPHTESADGFFVSPKAYRYADHGIYLCMKEKRNRLFIPLRDNNCYNRQVYVRLYPEEGNLTVNVPVIVRPKHPSGYCGETSVAMGMRSMLVTDTGNVYGERYLEYQSALTDYIRERLPRHRRSAGSNPGMKKYKAGRARREAALHTYVNAEINRMLETEKPEILYFPKLPSPSSAGINRRINATVSMWQRGYIKSRLIQKCRERSIEPVEVFGKGISGECSRCGAEGKRENRLFICPACGLEMQERQNAAVNVLKRGREPKEKRNPLLL